MINQSTIDQIFDSADIVQLIGDYVKLSPKGSNFTGLCPFHNEKTPSFSVSPSKNIFKCFGCGESGNPVSFIMKHNKLSYPEALTFLANKYSITIQKDKPDSNYEKSQNLKQALFDFNRFALNHYRNLLFKEENALALEYISSRYNMDMLDRFDIGYSGKYNQLYHVAKAAGYKEDFLLSTGLIRQNEKTHQLYDFFRDRIMFPISDRHGNIISFSGRVLPMADSKYGKYINGPETLAYIKSNTLFNINLALDQIRKQKQTILVEGNPDVIAMHQIHIENTTAALGTSLSESQIATLKKLSDEVLLLYDGDKAGENALIKNGKAIVKNNLATNCAILPKGEDPDSFFTSNEHFHQWLKENQSDFISWYSEFLFSKINNNPSKKNDAVTKICDLLYHLPQIKREIYIDLVSKQSKLKAKLFTDQLKQLELENKPTEEEKPVFPKGVEPSDYEKWGFYEYDNAYFFRSKQGFPEKLSNFIMIPIFHIDSIHESSRIYELRNEHGYRVVVNLDMNEMTSLQGFQRNVESKGNFMFWGSMAHFQKLKLRLYEQTRTCLKIDNLGWQKEGFYAFSNGILDDDNNFVQIDEYGVVTYRKDNYFIPAFSKIYIKDKSIFIEERKFRFSESNVSLNDWMNLYYRVHGRNSMIAFAWYLAALYRDHILNCHSNFPILNLFGQKGSGKNTLAYSLLSLFGKRQTEYNIHNGTKPGLAKHLEMFSNAICFVDEYKNSLDFEKIETLKSIYNAIGRSRINMDKGGRKETTQVNSGVILAGQEMPTVDVALSTRTIYLQFLTKEGLSKEQKQDFDTLQQMELPGLSHITKLMLSQREYFLQNYLTEYNSVISELQAETGSEDINDRILRNSAIVLAAFRTLSVKINFTFSYSKLYENTLEVIRDHNRQIKQSDEIGVFWSLLEAMFDDNILIDRWHFAINMVTHIKTTQRTVNFPQGMLVLKFKFNAIAKLYSEQLRRRGEKPLPHDSLQHYLKTNKYFLGVEKSYKFIRKDYDPSEGKPVERKQTTTAFCFDYNALGINLERFEIENKAENLKDLVGSFQKTIDYQSNGTITAPADSQPF